MFYFFSPPARPAQLHHNRSKLNTKGCSFRTGPRAPWSRVGPSLSQAAHLSCGKLAEVSFTSRSQAPSTNVGQSLPSGSGPTEGSSSGRMVREGRGRHSDFKLSTERHLSFSQRPTGLLRPAYLSGTVQGRPAARAPPPGRLKMLWNQ